MFSYPRVLGLALVLATTASPAVAQRTAPRAASQSDWTHGTTVSLAGGLAHGSSDTGALLGAAVGWELRPRLAVEGSGQWLDRRDGAEGFAAALKVRAGLTGAGVSPFVEGGFGLYRLSAPNPANLPAFYRRRMDNGAVSVAPFTDPMFQVGGGINVFMSRKVALQPAVEAMIVTRDGHALTMAAVSLRVAYHFEDHPVTPSR